MLRSNKHFFVLPENLPIGENVAVRAFYLDSEAAEANGVLQDNNSDDEKRFDYRQLTRLTTLL